MPVETPPDCKQDPTSNTTASRIGEQLASHIGSHKYEMWFGNAELRVSGEKVEVSTDSPFVAKWIDAHFSDELRGIASQALGREAQIEVRIAPELSDSRQSGECTPTAKAEDEQGREWDPQLPRRPRKQAAAAKASSVKTASPNAHRRDARTNSRRGLNFRKLDEFVVGQSNRLAFSAACRLVEEQQAPAVSPLFIHGDCGLGKTHLLQGICRRFADITGRRECVRYVTGEQFTNEYIASIRNNTVDAFRRRIRKLDLLAIDDVHFLSNKVRTQSEFLHTLDAIDLSGARIVLASDEHPRLIKKFSQALTSRFLSGMVVQVERPDRATRIEIVHRLATARRIRINEAAVEMVASRCVGSVRELEGALTKLAALRSLASEAANGGTVANQGAKQRALGNAREEVGLVLVEQLFKDHGWKPPTPVRLGTVIDVTCRQLGISRADLMGSSRHRRIVLSRGLVAYLCREMTTHSYPEIARALGRSYHSTIHTAEQRLRRQLNEDKIVDPGKSQEPVALKELADRLRHEITRVTTRM